MLSGLTILDSMIDNQTYKKLATDNNNNNNK